MPPRTSSPKPPSTIAELKPQVDATFPLAEAAKAHAYLEGGSHVGKVVLRV